MDEPGYATLSRTEQGESGVRRHWKTMVITVVVAVLGLSVVAAAYGATKSGSSKKSRTFAAACAQLLKDPQAVSGHAGPACRASEGDAGLVEQLRERPHER